MTHYIMRQKSHQFRVTIVNYIEVKLKLFRNIIKKEASVNNGKH